MRLTPPHRRHRSPHHRALSSRLISPGRAIALVGVFVAATLLLPEAAAQAETVQYVALAQTVDQVLSNIRNWIMGILAGVALVFFTIGGLRYLMAGDNPGEVEKAKGAFKAAGIGFGLAALAPLVVEILKTIVGGL
ncbi:pilin [Streptomyces sp. MN03-5084-2B]|nr:pilin [Streptomyces sp. MN03-5084-2B]